MNILLLFGPSVLFILHLFAIGAVSSSGVVSINGAWTTWSTVATPCMKNLTGGKLIEVSCGGGKTVRRRSCTNPAPQVSLGHLTTLSTFIP